MTSGSSPSIFISYRRSETGGHARSLAADLKRTFGEDNVFFDVESIDEGDTFPDRIDSALRGAKVVLVVIGKTWTRTLNRRAEQPGIDYVLREVEIALQRKRADGILVVPVRVDSARFSRRSKLLPALRSTIEPLLDIQMSVFDSDRAWQHAYDALIARISVALSSFGVATAEQRDALIVGNLLSDLKRWTRETLDDPRLARLRLHKPISTASSVLRSKVVVAIEQAVADPRIRTIVIAGEEGTGKTVALAQWLRRSLDGLDGGVLFTSAQESHRWSRDPIEFLRQGLKQRQVRSEALDVLRRSDGSGTGLGARKWLVIVDGINEEGTARDWGELIAVFAGSSTLDLRVVVTTRTEQLERQLSSYVSHDTCRKVVVPDLDDSELSQLLLRHGLSLADIQSNALPLVRRPRYFQRALAHHEELAGLHNIDFPTLVFLDWRDRESDRYGSPLRSVDFERVLYRFAEAARRDRSDALSRNDLRNQAFGDSSDDEFSRKIDELFNQRVITSDTSGRLDVNARLLPIGLGLLLLDVLKTSPKQERDALREVAAQWLGDQQDDVNAEICQAAIAAMAWTAQPPAMVVRVLLQHWLACQNRDTLSSAVHRLMQISARYSNDVVHVVEWMFNEGHAANLLPDVVDLFVDLYREAAHPHDAFDSAIDRWLGWHVPAHLTADRWSRSKPSPKTLLRRKHDDAALYKSALSIDPGILQVDWGAESCRKLAIAILESLPHRITPARIRRLVLSVSVGRHDDRLHRLSCLTRSASVDHLPALDDLRKDCAHLPALHAQVCEVVWHVWPTATTRSWHKPVDEEATFRRSWRDELHDRLIDPTAIPTSAELDLLRAELEASSESVDWTDSESLGFAYALYCPDEFRTAIEKTVALALDGTVKGDRDFELDAALFAPLLTLQQAFAMRDEVRARAKGKATSQRSCTGLLSLAGYWHRPPAVRATALSMLPSNERFVPFEMISRDWFNPYLGRSAGSTVEADVIARWLRRTDSLIAAKHHFRELNFSVSVSNRERSLLQRWLIDLDVGVPTSVPWNGRDDAIRWATREGLTAEAARLVPAQWAFNDRGRKPFEFDRLCQLQSTALAASGQLSLAEALRRLSPTDLPSWVRNHRASDEEIAVVELFLTKLLGLSTGGRHRDADPDQEDLDGIPESQARLRPLIEELLHMWRPENLDWPFPESRWPADDLHALFPGLVRRWRELKIDGNTIAYSFLHSIAESMPLRNITDAVDLLRALWKAENAGVHVRRIGYARAVVTLAFQLPDTALSRQLWEEMACKLPTDNELICFVACATAYNGGSWLKERIRDGLASSLPGREVEAAVMAGAAGFGGCVELIRARFEDAHGWRRDGFEFALELADQLAWARAWHRRFRQEPDPTAAFGAFLAYLKVVDPRLYVGAKPPADNPEADEAPERTRYFHTWHFLVDQAASRRANGLAKTLYQDYLGTRYVGLRAGGRWLQFQWSG